MVPRDGVRKGSTFNQVAGSATGKISSFLQGLAGRLSHPFGTAIPVHPTDCSPAACQPRESLFAKDVAQLLHKFSSFGRWQLIEIVLLPSNRRQVFGDGDA